MLGALVTCSCCGFGVSVDAAVWVYVGGDFVWCLHFVLCSLMFVV